MAFGQAVMPVYRFENADVILSLEDDFLFVDPGRLHYTRAFTDRRRVEADKTTMNRLYVIEGTPTITGSMADHRMSLRSSDLERFARALAERLGLTGAAPADVPDSWTHWLDALTDDLKAHGGTSLVTVGYGQPPIVHALAHWINATLKNSGKTVTYSAPLTAEAQAEFAACADRFDEQGQRFGAADFGGQSGLYGSGGHPVRGCAGESVV